MPTKEIKTFSTKEHQIIKMVAETILGVPWEELGDYFEQEVDEYVFMLPGYMKNDLHVLLKIFNFRVTTLILAKTLRPFTKMSPQKRTTYLQTWQQSRIPLMRTGYAGLKSIVGFGYYAQDKTLHEMDFPGTTIGKEHLTPTLLFGKQPWSPNK